MSTRIRFYVVTLASVVTCAAIVRDPDPKLEFETGSNVNVASLTPIQTANLALLGKVWGFLKYHHPKVVDGTVPWDHELFRAINPVLAAVDHADAQKAILRWVRAQGEIPLCRPCAALPDDLALAPDLDWIRDRALLGEPLSGLLQWVYRNRPARGEQAYVGKIAGVGNPEFKGEATYADKPLPDAGTRILALFRWWSVIEYWSPYRDIIGADWDNVLPEFLPRMVAANDWYRYQLTMLELISRLNDAHADLWGHLGARPPRGDCQIPVRLRLVEGKAVVSGYTHPERGPATKLRVGDVLLALDGVPIDELIEPWKPYYSASNDAGRMAALMNALTQGACGEVAVSVARVDAPSVKLTVKRRSRNESEPRAARTNDLPGAAFRRLSPEVAYLKLSAVKTAEIPQYLSNAEGTKGWIIDIRNYPAEFVVFKLGGHFVSEPTPFARFTMGDISNPGAFVWTEPPLALKPLAPRYPGKVVVLVDETSISQAEYTAMALRATPNAIVVGSTTVGADGNVSPVPLPGGLMSPISGIGVFYPDKRPTQRIGIVPDVEARPSIAGIREGRDEVLEVAVRQILGPSVQQSEIEAVCNAR